ncbi:MAG: cell division protein ZapA [Rhodospirillaceae bacterium]
MPLVDIYLSSRKYSVSCETGQEPRLRQLGDYVGGKLRELSESGLTGSDAHMLALTALLLADELFDVTEELDKARSRAPKDGGREAAVASVDAVSRRLEELASRLERS